MIQKRDLYTRDYIFKYVKLPNLQEFEMQMHSSERHFKHLLLFSEEDINYTKAIQFYFSMMTIGLLSGQLILQYYFKRLPLLKTISTKPKRAFARILLFFVPIIGFDSLMRSSMTQTLEGQFKKYNQQFKNYLETDKRGLILFFLLLFIFFIFLFCVMIMKSYLHYLKYRQ
ncbi:hypothetical protein pb186bvf_003969 [Paramecium bursaria]